MSDQKDFEIEITRRKTGFTQVYNHFLEYSSLSWKAKGIFIYILSRPKGWKLNIKGDVSKRSTDKERSIYSGIKELVDSGYISRTRNKDFYIKYHFFEFKEDNNVDDYILSRERNSDVTTSHSRNAHVQNAHEQNAHVQNSNGLTIPEDNNTECSNTDVINTLSASNDAMHDQVMELVEAWNQIQGYNGIEMTKVKSISKTSARYRATVSRIKEHGFDNAYDVLRKVSKSDFLRGDSKNRWTADFGWVMRPSNFEKIIEDTYINKEGVNERSGNNNPKGESYKEFATELSNRVDKNRHIYDELPDDYVF